MAVKQTQTQAQPQVKADVSNNNVLALLSYLSILFIVPMIVAKDDPYVKFHVKQGLVLFIFEIILMAVGIVPILGWLLSFAGSIMALILAIMGIMNAVSGTQKELPIIGKYAAKLNF